MKNKYFIQEKNTIYTILENLFISKKNIYKLLDNNCISIDNNILSKDSIVSNYFEVDFFNFENSLNITSCNKKINILYEDSDFIFVDKEKNCLVHSDGVSIDTLLNRIVYYLQSKNDYSYVRCLHRIDYEAKGVVCFSKNIISYNYVSHLFEKNEVLKIYHIIVSGKVLNNGSINIGIGKDRHNSKKYRVSKTGKESKLDYEVIKYIDNTTCLKVKLYTGRPHQIRVSFNYIKHSVCGDSLYGEGNNLMLLSKSISFNFLLKKYHIESKLSLWKK